MKCGKPGNVNRVFDLRSGDATVENCKAACAYNEDCIAFSGVMGCTGCTIQYNTIGWCIGCAVELDTAHSGDVAYEKPSANSSRFSL